MERQLIGRGLLAGALAGVLAFLWAKVLIEPVIGRAIDFENGVGAAHEAAHSHGGHTHGGESAEVFSRGVQSNIGMGFGVLIFSVAMGALLAVVFCAVYGRANLSARALSALTAGGMLVSLWIVPALKYPPNPPAVSLDGTIQQRTLLYLLVVVLSAALFVGSVLLARRLTPKLGVWNAILVGVADYVVSMAVVFLILPGIHETPSSFPADDLYEFRLYSLGTQVVIWTTIGLVFGALASKLLDEKKQSVAA